jgi:hypothetical protein
MPRALAEDTAASPRVVRASLEPENAIADADDGNECTMDSCLAGAPLHAPLPDTTPCRGGECNFGFCCAVGQICG